ncbi:hypothetical protein KUCAC02_013139 [Chaenocephalus aceratus]|uniref:Uncharacterized protein n=1 Tax=Chaenocephalus aceratus TaxID=36190 RepID=A0ACB9XEV5_CHAAC|nr:hypothetical protein KUCAC02_013139 [Chaenocephalus aceratus]
MSLLIVSRAASSLPPAQTLEFHEMASACESRSTHLVSRFTFPAAVPADRSGSAHHVADLQRRRVGLSLTATVCQWEVNATMAVSG